MRNVESSLFSMLVRDKLLRHPTARDFDATQWLLAAQHLDNRSPRDIRLLAAALYFGNEIAVLRAKYEEQLFTDMDRRSATLLSMAMANYNYIVLSGKTRRARGKDFVHLGLSGSLSIETAYPGNQLSPDAVSTALIDTLPHCLDRANRRPLKTIPLQRDYWELGTRLFSIMSVEHSLRDLWQLVLWEDWQLSKDGANRREDPVDRNLATLWHVWIWRHEIILSQGTNLDAMTDKILKLRGKEIDPFLSPTVVGIGGNSPENRRFRIGQVSGNTFEQGWHRTESIILDDSYLAPYMDAGLPRLSNTLTCRDLHRIWCVIRDCANILASRIKKRSFTEVADVEAYSLIIRRTEIERVISQCAKIDLENVRTAINFLTCNQFDLGTLFNQSFWSSPLLALDDNENLIIALAAVKVGSAIRRVESWLNRGGLSDHLSDAQRGLKYEARVRREIKERIKENVLLPNARCAARSIEGGNGGEQVDLVIVLGDLLLVGEIKCLLYPIEPIEHFNYLKKLDEAAIQAKRKANWLKLNPETLAKELQIPTEVISGLRVVPIVVTNQGAGFSLDANGVRVVDSHFLSLYLSDGEYVSGMVVDAEKAIMAPKSETLYRNEVDAARKFEETIADPPPLRRLLRAAKWRDNHFPGSDGNDLLVADCYQDNSIIEDANARATALGFKPQRRKS